MTSWISVDVIDYTWPLTCLHCDSYDVVYSETYQDYICQECGRWQTEERNDD